MSRDPFPNLRPGISDVGKRMIAITAAADDFPNASLIYATAAGAVTYVPEQNTNAEAVTETVAQGWVSPVLVRRVTSGTGFYQIITA